ncbi:hypothetical protein MBLNU457_g2506t2 [Dothideomycetes sp. NU457]
MPRVAAVEKSEQVKQKERKRIEEYKALVADITQRINDKQFTSETLLLTAKLLTQNPEYYTIWNYRRLLLQDVFAQSLSNPEDGEQEHASRPAGFTPAQQEIALLLKEELAFLTPLQRQWPKCYWIWNHRAWLLQQASEHLPTSASTELWKQELGLVSKMLSYDSRNFHAWQYRREVVASLETLSQQLAAATEGSEGQSEKTPASMVEQEFEYTTKMIKTNLSNFSAWHNRSNLIPRLLAERYATSQQRRELLDQELEFIMQALYTDPYDQSLWFYHQYLMATISPTCPEKAKIVTDVTNKDREEYLETQIDMVKDMLDGTDDCKWIYQGLLTLAEQYLEVEAGNKAVTTKEMTEWLDKLEELDPLRKGRWIDLRKKLKL